MTRALPSPEELREWLEGFVDGVKARGMQASGHCPLCEGRDDFSFSLGKGAWQCFRCGERGGIKALAEACGVELPPSWTGGAPGSAPEEAARIEAERRKSAEGEKSARLQAVQAARKLWSASAPAGPDHPYLTRKQIPPHGLRQSGGALVVPLMDASGELHGVQLIEADGSKRYPRCTAKTGHFWPLGGVEELRKAETVVIAEGVATAGSVAELFPSSGPFCAVAAMDAGNLLAVARGIKTALPGARRVIFAADNDARAGTAANPGVDHATRAAAALGGALVVPPAVPGDWNDRACARGIAAAREEFARAMKKAEEAGPLVEGKTVGAPAPSRKVRAINGNDLLRMEFPAPRWAVPDILPEGLSLLLGAPKMGKSTLALHLALAISTGGKAFGSVDVPAGDVLLAALEDSLRRLQGNIIAEVGDAVALSRLTVWTEAPRVGEGLLEEITAWLDGHEGARLVIVDTLQRVRPPKGRGVDAYETDYNTLARLQTLATTRGVAILVLHHTRKASRESRAPGDFMEESLGSQAITGAADGVLHWKRQRGSFVGTLSIAGRDVEEKALAVTWDRDTRTYRLEGDAETFTQNATHKKIIEAIRAAGGESTPAEVAERLGMNRSSVKTCILRLRDRGLLEAGTMKGASCIPGYSLRKEENLSPLNRLSKIPNPANPVNPVNPRIRESVNPPLADEVQASDGFTSPKSESGSESGGGLGETLARQRPTSAQKTIGFTDSPDSPTVPNSGPAPVEEKKRASAGFTDGFTSPKSESGGFPPPAPNLRPGDMDALDKLRATRGTKWTLPEAGELLGLRLTEAHKILYRLTEAGKLQNVPGQGWWLAQGLDWLGAEG
jgi:phage/plasmid primase-like uncharacterized protein/biotin operon repressor